MPTQFTTPLFDIRKNKEKQRLWERWIKSKSFVVSLGESVIFKWPAKTDVLFQRFSVKDSLYVNALDNNFIS